MGRPWSIPRSAPINVEEELKAFRRKLSKHLADAGGNDCAARAMFESALANADAALQLEYIGYGHPCAPDPRLDAYHNVQQVLALVLHPHRPPEYVEHDEGNAAYIAELVRLIKVLCARWQSDATEPSGREPEPSRKMRAALAGPVQIVIDAFTLSKSGLLFRAKRDRRGERQG